MKYVLRGVGNVVCIHDFNEIRCSMNFSVCGSNLVMVETVFIYGMFSKFDFGMLPFKCVFKVVKL